ncbi:MAG: HAMP domain-containing sensor histidine kinase [Candidatus Coatesbacteria bacterium]
MADASELRGAILEAQEEDQVVWALVKSCAVFGFENARYYDANYDRLAKEYGYTLRAASRTYAGAPVGFTIYRATISDAAIKSREPAWETYDEAHADLLKREWINKLELQGQGWVDIPIHSGARLVGLWAMDRKSARKLTGTERHHLRETASLAALKVDGLRERWICSVMDRLVGRSTAQDDCKAESAHSSDSFMRSLCLDLNAVFGSLFLFDPVRGRIAKKVEFLNDGVGASEVSAPWDREYRLGQCLTGKAFVDSRLRFIPDVGRLKSEEPDLIESRSEDWHVLEGREPLRTIMYGKLIVPPDASALLRFINRTDRPTLPFTPAHEALMDRAALCLSQVLALEHASQRLRSVWQGFSFALGRPYQGSANYAAIARAAADIGYPVFLITIWQDDGVLSASWANDKELSSEMKPLEGAAEWPEIHGLGPPGTKSLGAIPRALRNVLERRGVRRIYVVPTSSGRMEAAIREHTVSIIPIRIDDAENAEAEEQRSPDAIPDSHLSLDVLGGLVGSIRTIAHNRDLLLSADEAIGTIAHEMNTPSSALVTMAGVMADQLRELSSAIPDEVHSELGYQEVMDNGHFRWLRAVGRRQIGAYLETIDRRIDHYAVYVQKVVGDALVWARMGDKQIEMDFTDVNILDLLKLVVHEAKKRLDEKEAEIRAPFRVKMGENVSKVGSLVADLVLLHKMFANLLDNAIKYSHSRPGFDNVIVISAERQTGLVDVAFTNWGLGIDESDYENIFDRFYRSSVRDRRHTVRGVGLGLATCKKIALLHGGTIRVQSSPTLDDPDRVKAKEGYETTFTVRLSTNLKRGRKDIMGAGVPSHGGDK